MSQKAYLEFVLMANTGKTKIYNAGTAVFTLGQIRWYSPWRRYVFFPNHDTLYDASCLTQVTLFLEELMSERKRRKAATA